MDTSSAKSRRRREIFERDGNRCVYCAQILDRSQLTIDHVQPRVKRGDQSPGNLVTACVTCNTQKGGRTAWEWLSDRPVERENFLRYANHVWDRHRHAVRKAAR